MNNRKLGVLTPDPPLTYAQLTKVESNINDLRRDEQISTPSEAGYPPASNQSRTDDVAMRGLVWNYDRFGVDMLHADHYNGEAHEIEASRKALEESRHAIAKAQLEQKLAGYDTVKIDELQETVDREMNKLARRI